MAAIKELVELGLVVCERNHHQDGSRAANLFFLLLENRKHASPVWRGAVSTKERKAQAERFRKEALANLTEQVPQEASSADLHLGPMRGLQVSLPWRKPVGKFRKKPVVQNLHLGPRGRAKTPENQ
ncbi:hypothetical protein GU243_23260 [Pseudarthrobacter psychrotolerans]|uniref:Uncharacterized protein n=1 Tax=Pseudarthrobacter psychrotolerans TaxID=2697569 RepID=A0A6P1NTL8_9MICC|nr:hypothetical protein [Pseudarthrobacter psychrotolerans]QHK22097.1 hypothetical protein GU243_23260 [Pseudarthrobacter psychrotolerans]